jgi:hypothetical protein
MQPTAIDNLSSARRSIEPERLLDDPHQKVLRVPHRLEQAAGAQFDVTLRFRWQATNEEPHHFAGFNLGHLKHQVSRLRYASHDVRG